jgi:hypothetical protein
MAYTKDQRIINENPTLTAYELLMQKGLSQEKYNELVQSNYQPKAPIQPTVTERITPPQPVQAKVTRAEPKLSKPHVPANQKKMAFLRNKSTGKITRMTRASAEFAARLDKNFEVR